jgi:hypothetical protein
MQIFDIRKKKRKEKKKKEPGAESINPMHLVNPSYSLLALVARGLHSKCEWLDAGIYA